jgi:N-dimethylarginine dimethylaminohydrolase
MCPPAHFDVLYEINPWMHTEVKADPDKTLEQWEQLTSVLRAAGATVEVLNPVDGLPDLVFTANAGTVDTSLFVPARFRHAERQPETPHNIAWFEAQGFKVELLPEGVVHEGAGDSLPFAGTLLCGYRTRSDAAAGAVLSKLTGAPTRSVELVDPRLYHLDLTFCPLDDRHAIIAPSGWDTYGCRVVEALVPEPLVLDEAETAKFLCNSVVVGDTVVMPECTPRVGRILESWGFEVVTVDVSEFQKAGGACRCLTLALDVTLGTLGTPG